MNSLTKSEKIKKENTILLGIAYIPLLVITTRIGMLMNVGYKLDLNIMDTTIKSLTYKPLALPSSVGDLKGAFAFTIAWGLVMLSYVTKKEKYMDRKEYGTAEWGKQKEIDKFKDEEEYKNIILSKEVQFSINDKKTMRNNNILIVGGSGTGKTRFYVKPNIMQMHSSYVITDPKGELLKDTGTMLEEEGYVIKVFDLYNMDKSNKYNPFEYIKDEKDILKVINNLITNTNSGQKSSDPFWEKAETALLQSLFAFIWSYLDKRDQNFSSILRLLEKIETKETNEEHISPMDKIMAHYHNQYPNNFAYRQWLIFKQASSKTAKSILISTAVRLSMFNIQSLANLTSEDEMELAKIGDRKTAVFILVSDSDSTYNFLVSMFYQQMFEILYYQADFMNDGKLKYPVRCIIDEFANIGQIPEFEKRLSTMRSRGISSSIIIQNLSQLEELYKNNYKTIIGNCDSFVYLGGIEKDSHKYVSELLGKGTIDNRTRGKTRGRSDSTNENFQRMGRELLTQDEVARMDNKNCIVIYRGLQPFFSNKYDIKDHKNYFKLYEDNNNRQFSFSSYYEELGKSKLSLKNLFDKFNIIDEKLERLDTQTILKDEYLSNQEPNDKLETKFTVAESTQETEEVSSESKEINNEVKEVSNETSEKTEEKHTNLANQIEEALDIN